MSIATDTAITSVQRIATELRPVVLDSLGLCAAIEWQAKDFETRTGIRCSATVPEVSSTLSRDHSTALFRILQESLTNVARHSKATLVEIELHCEDGWILLEVRDNGCGVRANELTDPKSLGLLGMRERAALLGGQCQIRNSPLGGTAVEARLPLAQ
jgi:signal transduction histidine kinase